MTRIVNFEIGNWNFRIEKFFKVQFGTPDTCKCLQSLNMEMKKFCKAYAWKAPSSKLSPFKPRGLIFR